MPFVILLVKLVFSSSINVIVIYRPPLDIANIISVDIRSHYTCVVALNISLIIKNDFGCKTLYIEHLSIQIIKI